jgi:hypothetical protein
VERKMITEETTQDTPEECKNYEMEFHREIMSSCRKYIKKISIFSMIGILDYVKQEAIELENATSHNLKNDPTIDID